MKKITKNTFTLIFFILSSTIVFSQTKDTIYFDKKWKKTDRKHHKFYRLMPLKTTGKLSLIIDYYKNGKMQMQAYAYTDSLDKYVGTMYFYHKSGIDYYSYFKKNPTDETLKYYHHNGALWKEVPYKNSLRDGTVNIYDNKNRLRYSEKYEKGKRLNNKIYTLYWIDTQQKAKEIHYSKNQQIQKEERYDRNGNLICVYKKSDFINNKLKKGIYYQEKTENGFVVDFEKSTESFQSKIIELNDIDYVNIERNYNNFIKKNSTHKYLCAKSWLERDYSLPQKLFQINLSELDENDEKKEDLISVKNIKKQTVTELLNTIYTKEWEINFIEKDDENSYYDDSNKHKTIFKQFNESLFMNLELYYGNYSKGGFGSFYTKDDDDKKKWRVENVKFYTINVILLNGEKPILALSPKDGFEYFIIPLKDGSFYTNYKRKSYNKIDVKLKNKTSLTPDILGEIMLYKSTKDFYSTVTKNNKKYIANEFNEILIDQAYDSIQKVAQFIVCKNGENIDIYNFKLDKLPVKNIRAAYFDRSNLQLLQGNKLLFINSLGEQTERQKIVYYVCGTVSSTDFFIEDSIKENPRIHIHHGGVSSHEYSEYIYLTNLKNKQDITFLNKTKTDGYDGNSFIVAGYINRTQTLLVKDNDKFGLYSYPRELEHNINEREKKTNAKELLPIEYSSIELREPLIILKKDKKFGIYNDPKGLIYKYLGKINANFMRYEKLNGEKGWIDINNFENYPDK